MHGLNHTVDWKITGRLASGSVPATLVTLAVISHYNLSGSSSARMIALVLGVMLLLTAVSLILRQRFLRLMEPVLVKVSDRQAARLTVIVGAILGALVTLSSVGAGALGVTALLMLYPRHRMAVIVGSDIAHAVPLTLVAGDRPLVAGVGRPAAAVVAADRVYPGHHPGQLPVGPGAGSRAADRAGGGAGRCRRPVGAVADRRGAGACQTDPRGH